MFIMNLRKIPFILLYHLTGIICVVCLVSLRFCFRERGKGKQICPPSCLFTCGVQSLSLHSNHSHFLKTRSVLPSLGAEVKVKEWWAWTSSPAAMHRGDPDLVRHWNGSDKLLPPVLTQGNVCTTSCWHGADISNKSDIHSQTAVTFTLHGMLGVHYWAVIHSTWLVWISDALEELMFSSSPTQFSACFKCLQCALIKLIAVFQLVRWMSC